MSVTGRKFMAFVLSSSLLLGLSATSFSRETSRSISLPVQQPDQAGVALQEGRRLLKRGKADQALGRLQTALNLYTAAKNRKGIAAAHNELGDLYLRQGQTKTALEHYQQAYDALTGALAQEQKNTAAAGTAARMASSSKAGEVVDTAASASDTSFNSKLILAKIGDTNYQLGQMSAAAASYALMNPKPESAAKKQAASLASWPLPSSSATLLTAPLLARPPGRLVARWSQRTSLINIAFPSFT